MTSFNESQYLFNKTLNSFHMNTEYTVTETVPAKTEVSKTISNGRDMP